MRRREFITLLGGAAAAWPIVARGQQPALPVVGFINSSSPRDLDYRVISLRRGLGDVGYIEGQNVAIEYRWAEGHYDRLPSLAADLVRRRVAVIAVTSTPGAMAAKAASAAIPIVFAIGADPIKFGLVASLNRPGGNVTGVSFLINSLVAKQLEVLHEALPRTLTVGFLVNPTNPSGDFDTADAHGAANALGRKLVVAKASTATEFESAFATLVQQGAGAVSVGADPFFDNQPETLVALAARYGLPAIYPYREYAVVGGLMSYGTNRADAIRQIGIYAGRILKGDDPAHLPVQQSTRIELVVNLKAAKAGRIEVPTSLLLRADEVIE
jgi:putative tryptophan/tyrosine transport system substrate-binding protein